MRTIAQFFGIRLARVLNAMMSAGSFRAATRGALDQYSAQKRIAARSYSGNDLILSAGMFTWYESAIGCKVIKCFESMDINKLGKENHRCEGANTWGADEINNRLTIPVVLC